VSIVLMTDGLNNTGPAADQFLAGLDSPERPPVPIFTIRIGEADPAELARAATATGGRSVDVGSDLSTLSTAFEDLRGCR
jgi:Ca-activated chloride channel homolog